MTEVNEAAQVIAQAADPDANIIFGATIKEDQLDQIKISVIATGFDETRRRLREYIGSGVGSSSLGAQPTSNWSEQVEETPVQTVAEAEEQQAEIREEDEEDDLEIPAFLRSNR